MAAARADITRPSAGSKFVQQPSLHPERVDSRLDASAVAALTKWHFEPALKMVKLLRCSSGQSSVSREKAGKIGCSIFS
jgi:hypothetical protein